jgi:hypothetical protein
MKKERQSVMKPDLSEMARRWTSPYVVRSQKDLDRFAGGLLNARYMSNLDSQGKGPKGRIRIGKKVAYPTQNLIEWMEERGVKCDELI